MPECGIPQVNNKSKLCAPQQSWNFCRSLALACIPVNSFRPTDSKNTKHTQHWRHRQQTRRKNSTSPNGRILLTHSKDSPLKRYTCSWTKLPSSKNLHTPVYCWNRVFLNPSKSSRKKTVALISKFSQIIEKVQKKKYCQFWLVADVLHIFWKLFCDTEYTILKISPEQSNVINPIVMG